MNGISYQAHDVRRAALQGFPGQVVRSDGHNRQRSFLNANPQRVKVQTITIDTGTNGRTYAATIGGKTVSFTAVDTNTTNIATGLAAAMNADPIVRGRGVATSASAVITYTGLYPGDDILITAVDAQASLVVTQSAVEADPIPFGRAILSLGYDAGQAEELCALAASAALEAQVKTATIAYVASNVLEAAVFEVRGDERILLARVNVTSATNQDTMINALVTALNAALPANTVLAAPDVGSGAVAVVATAEVVGFEFDLEVTHISGGASSPAITIADTTGPSAATSVHRALAGIACHGRDEAPTTRTATAGEYAGNAGVLAWTDAPVWVVHDGDVTPGGTVYLELAGDSTGQLYAAGSATRVGLAKSMARWDAPGTNNAQDGVAAVRIRL